MRGFILMETQDYREGGVKRILGNILFHLLMEGVVLKCLLWRLKALREERGWTQEKFAEMAGMSYKYYQAVEAGRKKDLRLSTLERLAKGHDIEVWRLLAPIRKGTTGCSGDG